MQLPVRFGKYELLEFLGGGMSRVYRARDTVLDRTVAVKILTPEGIADADTRTRFLHEAKVSAGLMHDHVIRIFDYGEEQGWPFIVMEFLVGSDLKHAIRNQTTGDTPNKLRILIEGAKALAYVHKQRLVHRDIKPDNMHIDEHGRVRLMDFGIAKTEDMSLTKTGFQVGTPFYMSPEQVNGEKATERADIYAYGMVMFEVFAEERAVSGDTITAIFASILNKPVDLDKMRAKGAPEAVVQLVGRMTAKDPMQRPASFGDVIAELETAAGVANPANSETVALPVEAHAGGLSGKKLTIGLLTVAVLLSAVVAVLMLRSKDAIEGKQADGSPPPESRTTETGEMRLVKGGNFLYGAEKLQGGMPAFYIDRTEVTNGAYRKFCDAKSRALPKGIESADPALPVVNVTILDAKDFCAWAGKRLPNALEWEKAARGGDGRKFPWGDADDASKANVADNPQAPKTLVAADGLAESASPYGVLNLAGNVWEWVDDTRTPSVQAIQSFATLLTPAPTPEEPWYQVKGGSYKQPLAYAVPWEFIAMPARYAREDVGFRCVAGVK